MTIKDLKEWSVSEDVRKHKRVEQTIDVMWAMDSRRSSGRGRLLNVNVSGACVQVDQPLPSGDGSIMSVMSSQVPALPTKGIVRWCRPIPGRQSAFLCGITFVDTSVDQARWKEWTTAHLG